MNIVNDKMSDTPETDAAWSCFKGYMEPLQDVKDLSRKLERERDEAKAAAKVAYSILGKVNKRSLKTAAWRADIKHINNTPMDWLKSIVQKWEEAK